MQKDQWLLDQNAKSHRALKAEQKRKAQAKAKAKALKAKYMEAK